MRESDFSWRLGSSESIQLRTAETAPDSVILRRKAESRLESLVSWWSESSLELRVEDWEVRVKIRVWDSRYRCGLGRERRV